MFVKIIYRHFVFNQEKYQVCKFRIYRHFVKSVNGSNFPVRFRDVVLVKPSLLFLLDSTKQGTASNVMQMVEVKKKTKNQYVCKFD